ncbi:MAG TPA: TAXI family TRAP transporter solute-binding subunit [Rhodocyclaceae bacterium]
MENNAAGNNRLKKLRALRLPRIPRISWRDLAATLGPVLLASAAAIALAIHYVQPAPPSTIVISTGPDGSAFRSTAEKYKKILERNGIKLEILPSEGSLDNLKRVMDPDGKVDVAFVQGGVATGRDIKGVSSLGSVSYAPVAIFYRSRHPIHRLSELAGQRIAIGPDGSGSYALALAMLKANEIEPGGKTKLLELGGKDAMDALLGHDADAIFLAGDSVAQGNIRTMLHTKGVRMFEFPQADGYVRRFRYLSKLEIPAGAFDLGANLPHHAIPMLAPTVELIAREDLHPALSDLMIEAAREVHGRSTLLQKTGEFPAPLEHEYPISAEAQRYYKSGKSFAYKHLPFWLASLADRVVVVLVPIIVVLIPGLRLVPVAYGWRIRQRIYKRYGELMALERASLSPVTEDERAALLARLDEIEKSTIAGKIPGSFADETYLLRQHIKFVRDRLQQAIATVPPDQGAERLAGSAIEPTS